MGANNYRAPQNTLPIPILRMETLQMIRIDRGPYRQWDSLGRTSATIASAFVVLYLTCPALTEIYLHLDGDTCIRHLRNFFLRSLPALQSLHLHIIGKPQGVGAEMSLLNRVIATLALLPSLSEFRFESHSLDDVGPLLHALTGDPGLQTTFALLPIVERLEFHSACAQLSYFIDFINHRWHVHDRTLKMLRLVQCSTRRQRPRFPVFQVGDAPSQLRKEWIAVKNCVEEGLQLEIL